jgi:hypothetical protein
MVGRSLVFALVFLLCVAALVAPILVDALHWWPRKRKTVNLSVIALLAPVTLLRSQPPVYWVGNDGNESRTLETLLGLSSTDSSPRWLRGNLVDPQP